MHKEDFQIFNNYRKDHGNEMIYLDSAASSLTPDIVVEKMNDYYFNYRANIDRGLYKSAERATAEYDNARKKVASSIGAEKDEVIFTAGATDSSNLLIRLIEEHMQAHKDYYKIKDEIVLSNTAHHSELLPLQEYANRNNLKIVLGFENIGEKTLIVSCAYASNITGEIYDTENIFKRASEVKAFTICDMTAAAGHIAIDVKKVNCDAAYFSAHKMCGPTGVGVLYIKKDIWNSMKPVNFGGGMVWEVEQNKSNYRSDVRKLESGTPNVAGVIGLSAAVEYIDSRNISNIRSHTKEVSAYAIEKLSELEQENKIKLHTKKDVEKNIGIMSFEIVGVHAHDVAQILADNNIAVRSGHHCAQLYIKSCNVSALTRASFYFYNTKEDVDALANGIKKVLEKFGK